MRGEGGPGAINVLIVPEPVFPYYSYGLREASLFSDSRIVPFDTPPPVPCSFPDGPTGVSAPPARTVKAERQEAASRFTSLPHLV